MLSDLFLNVALLSPEWVIWFLAGLSIYSIALIFERYFFYQKCSRYTASFRTSIEFAAREGDWKKALKVAEKKTLDDQKRQAPDFEAGICRDLIDHRLHGGKKLPPEIFLELGTEATRDRVSKTKIKWEKNLAMLATIGSNAPFIGLFGTVLGIIQAFNDLSRQAQTGVTSTITAGLAEALVATAVGILVAIPSVVAFNLYQRRVKTAVAEAEGFKSFLIAKLSER